jgi:uncharacterized membrane protein YkvA (DUF1232 family)
MKMPRLKEKLEALAKEVYAIYLALRDLSVPWYVKAFMAAVVGLLDDLILVPLGVALVVRMLPGEVLDDCRRRADSKMASEKPKVVAAAAIVVLLWLGIAFAVARKAVKVRTYP